MATPVANGPRGPRSPLGRKSKQPTRRAAAPPPEPPPLASGRVRTAELAGSMLWAAPLLALLTIPAAAILSIDVTNDPQQLAFLYGVALLGTWATLVPNKLIEFRSSTGLTAA